MKRILLLNPIFITITFLLVCLHIRAQVQNTENERYNLAVYATGTQNAQPLSTPLLTIVQNKTITKLTSEGNYRLIERSEEFLQQIKKEQTTQHSGDVADGQIAEIGAGYGAQKVCVVSVTILDQYLYIATRIVDVVTKTSYESGDAENESYTSFSILTKTLETSLEKMLSVSKKTHNTSEIPVKPIQQEQSKESAQIAESNRSSKESTTTIDQAVTSQRSDNHQSYQNNSTVVETSNIKSESVPGLNAYQKREIPDRNVFLGFNLSVGMPMTMPSHDSYYDDWEDSDGLYHSHGERDFSFGKGLCPELGMDVAWPVSNRFAIGFYINVGFTYTWCREIGYYYTSIDYYYYNDLHDSGSWFRDRHGGFDVKIGLLMLAGNLNARPFIIGLAPCSGFNYTSDQIFLPLELRFGRVLSKHFYMTGNINGGFGLDDVPFMVEPSLTIGCHFGDKIKMKKK